MTAGFAELIVFSEWRGFEGIKSPRFPLIGPQASKFELRNPLGQDCTPDRNYGPWFAKSPVALRFRLYGNDGVVGGKEK